MTKSQVLMSSSEIRLGHLSLEFHWSLVIGHWSLLVGHCSLAIAAHPRNPRDHPRALSFAAVEQAENLLPPSAQLYHSLVGRARGDVFRQQADFQLGLPGHHGGVRCF